VHYGIPFIRWDSQGLASNFKPIKFGANGEAWGLGESDPGGVCFTSAKAKFMFPVPPCAPVEGAPFSKNSACRQGGSNEERF
jgi:hypothetical protein